MQNITTNDHSRIIDGLSLYLDAQTKGTEEYTATEALIQQLEASHGGGPSLQARLDEALELLHMLDGALCSILRDDDNHDEVDGGDTVEWLGEFSHPLGAFLAKNPLPEKGG